MKMLSIVLATLIFSTGCATIKKAPSQAYKASQMLDCKVKK